MASLDQGEGYLGRLVSDPNEAERMSATVEGLRRSAVELELLLRSTRQVVDQVKTGPGLMHQVFYGKEGERAVSQIGSAAEELAVSLHQVREGKSLAHSLLYEEDSAQLVQNLSEASRDLKLLFADMKAGKGTVGALLSDPSVYEDLKVLLGNVGRNRSLRALVRFSIQKDDAAPSVQAEEKGGGAAEPATETSAQTLGSGARSE